MANKIETRSKNIKPRTNLNHNMYNSLNIINLYSLFFTFSLFMCCHIGLTKFLIQLLQFYNEKLSKVLCMMLLLYLFQIHSFIFPSIMLTSHTGKHVVHILQSMSTRMINPSNGKTFFKNLHFCCSMQLFRCKYSMNVHVTDSTSSACGFVQNKNCLRSVVTRYL